MGDAGRIGILGAGWVGLVTGACFAELGHDVIVRDVVPERIDALRAGRMPFHEQDLPEVLERNRERLRFTLEAGERADADILFICVQTPPTYAGDADLSFVWSALDDVARGVGLDHRLGPHFLRAGIGYGGSCLTGDETVLVRVNGRTRLVELERLYAETEDADAVEVAAWSPATLRAEFAPVVALTRREIDGDIVELRTKMGRRVRCTVDHPWVTRDGIKPADELTAADWLPLAAPAVSGEDKIFDVLGSAVAAGIADDEIIVRPAPLALEANAAKALQATVSHPRGAVARSHDIVRCGALRLQEARAADVSLAGA